jgi:hypothetical protein
MENFVDDNEAYFRLKPKCDCGDVAHCGHSCIEEDCDCTECRCPSCLAQQ